LFDVDQPKSRAMPVEYGNPLYLLGNLTSAKPKQYAGAE